MKTLKKALAIVLSLMMVISALGVSASAASLRKLDLAFVVDTTGSMGGDIYEVKENMKDYLDDLTASGMDFRIAVIDYRDFESRTGYGDYPYKVQCDFTSDYDTILAAINGLTLGGGGDWEETIYSALIDGLDELSWRDDAGKSAILMGDAPALDPEPITGYTLDMALNALDHGDVAYEEDIRDWTKSGVDAVSAPQAEKRSAITLFAIATSYDSETVACFEALSEPTGGDCYTTSDSEEITGIITEIIDVIPDVVIDPTIEFTFFDQIKEFFLNLFYLITFQFDKVDWDALGGSLLCSTGVEF